LVVGPARRQSQNRGGLIYETGANDVTYAPGYDGMGRVTRMPWDRNGTLIAGFNYSFDKASNITQKVLDHRASDPSEDYTIDGLYQAVLRFAVVPSGRRAVSAARKNLWPVVNYRYLGPSYLGEVWLVRGETLLCSMIKSAITATTRPWQEIALGCGWTRGKCSD
jgi:hypothetical protein